jgi:oxalate---CoA ligase
MSQVRELLYRRVATDAGRPAFVHGRSGESVTWGELDRRAERWGAQFARPAEDGSVLVGLVLGSPVLFCSSYLAALSSGTPVAPLDPRATADELAERTSVLALTDVVGDGLDASQTEAVADAGARVWTVTDRALQLVADVTERWAPPKRAAPSVVLATSGSTGRPKLVPLSEDQLVHAATQVADHHVIGREDRGYCPLPLFHINAQVVGILSTLVSGASLVVEERFARDDFWQVAARHEVTWLNLVPAIIAAVTRSVPPGSSNGSIRFARSASSPLPDAVRERFESMSGIGVLETYGMTEAASQITANPRRSEDRRAGSVGRPVGIELRITDPEGRVVPPGQTGEVQIRGRTVIEHYLLPGRIDWMSARNADGWFATGDLGQLDGQGFLFLVGRTDDVINRGGEKVYPREIEEVLRRDERVSNAVATSRPHPSLGAQPVAFVATSIAPDDRGRLAEELARSCEAALSRYKRPAEIFVTDELPVGATGKVARQRLAELFELDAVGTNGGGR